MKQVVHGPVDIKGAWALLLQCIIVLGWAWLTFIAKDLENSWAQIFKRANIHTNSRQKTHVAEQKKA